MDIRPHSEAAVSLQNIYNRVEADWEKIGLAILQVLRLDFDHLFSWKLVLWDCLARFEQYFWLLKWGKHANILLLFVNLFPLGAHVPNNAFLGPRVCSTELLELNWDQLAQVRLFLEQYILLFGQFELHDDIWGKIVGVKGPFQIPDLPCDDVVHLELILRDELMPCEGNQLLQG